MKLFRTWMPWVALLAAAAGAVAPLAAAAAPATPAASRTVAAPALARSEVRVTLPEARLLRQDGKTLSLRKALDDPRPVLLNFVFTTCSTICPVTSHVFAEVREQLGADRDRVHLVSVSIDPEFDTLERLRAYSEKLGSGAGWSFFTGSEADSLTVQRAFQAYQGDKMNHLAISFLRAAPGQPWTRLDGLATPAQLLAEVRGVLEARARAALALPGGMSLAAR